MQSPHVQRVNLACQDSPALMKLCVLACLCLILGLGGRNKIPHLPVNLVVAGLPWLAGYGETRTTRAWYLTPSLPQPKKNPGLKDAQSRLQTVYFPVL